MVLHQPSGRRTGDAPDLELHAKEIVRLRGQMEEILARHTGRSVEQIREDTDRTWSCPPRRPWTTGWRTRSWTAGN
jgi:ATP-dependent protease ClpP protease subunit